MPFQLEAPYQAAGDQPHAIKALAQGIGENIHAQTLLGATGTGKTFTMAKIIEATNKPTLIISHNKTLAAQLYAEFKNFFPHNAVEYFVSYYDYYQPEAYIPTTGTYIEKDLAINAEIEKLRLRAASALLSGRRDIIVIASVSCIYGMSNPHEFHKQVIRIKKNEILKRDHLLSRLVTLLYNRNDKIFSPGTFRVKGDTVDVFLAYTQMAYRFFFFGDEVEEIHRINPEKGEKISNETHAVIYPANLFVTNPDTIELVIKQIKKELDTQCLFLKNKRQSMEAERLHNRTILDIEMMQTLGYCAGIENYSRYFDQRQPNQRPYCLLDYFPDDYLIFIDESHVSLPQIRAMWGGDNARKRHLVEYGFRLPSAMDNRPLNFAEFQSLINQVIFVSATPGDYELAQSNGIVVEQLIRPTGLLDPKIHIFPTQYQIDHLIDAIQERRAKKEQIIIITLTKRMAEELTKYMTEKAIPCQYIHSEVDTLDRVRILQELSDGKFDVLIGVNLLREGLDLPQVSLVAILEADKEGFLRNTRSLIQMIGRAARHINGEVYMYADKMTPSMQQAITETKRRRTLQLAHNKKHNITPKPVKKAINTLANTQNYTTNTITPTPLQETQTPYQSKKEIQKLIKKIKKKMEQASTNMEYIQAQQYKEQLENLQQTLANHPT